MILSLLARDPDFAIRIGGTRITFVPMAEVNEKPTIQIVDPSPQNLVLDDPEEVIRFLNSARSAGVIPSVINVFQDDSGPYSDLAPAWHEFPLLAPTGRVVLNFTNLGSATAALILLLTGTPVNEVDWDRVFPEQLVGNPKAPAEVEAFINWHKVSDTE